jgi:subtilisin family serine protease
MIKRIALFALVAALILPFTMSTTDANPGQSRVIVMLNNGAPNDVAAAHGVGLNHAFSNALNGFSGTIGNGRLAQLAADERVAGVWIDEEVSIDKRGGNGGGPPGGGGGGGGTAPDPQTIPTGISRCGATNSATAAIDGTGGDADIDIAIIDTGISAHDDLNLAGGANFSKGKPGKYSDGHGHGTHVAGTAAAKDNNLGVVGVCPGARVWAVRVLDNNGSGWMSDIIAGVDWVTGHGGIEVANMSLGGSGDDTDPNHPYQVAINACVASGVTVVVAAGNSSEDSASHVPAAYDSVITVSALADSDGQGGMLGDATSYGDDDSFATFSNFGADVDICAPGVDIRSTYRDNGFATSSGTSMASPHVAGAAALYLVANPGKTPAEVKAALIAAGTPQNDPTNGMTGDPDGIAEPLLNVSGF